MEVYEHEAKRTILLLPAGYAPLCRAQFLLALRPEGQKNGVSLTSPESASETEASQKESSAVSSSEKSVQAAFDAFTKQIFKDELEGSGLTLHYMLKDPENYGIPQRIRSLENVLWNNLEQVSADMEKLSEELHALILLLTADQLFTYRALDDYLETELAARGLELYTRPVSTTIGTQAQLPILFAEYAFMTGRM